MRLTNFAIKAHCDAQEQVARRLCVVVVAILIALAYRWFA